MSAPRRRPTAQDAAEKQRQRDARDLAIAAALEAGQTWKEIERELGVCPAQIAAVRKGMQEADQ